MIEYFQQKEIYDSQMISCTDEESLREGEVAEAQAAYSAASKQFTDCQNAEVIANTDRVLITSVSGTKRDQLDTEVRLRKLENELFLRREAEYTSLLATIAEAMAIAERLSDTVSNEAMTFVQVSQKITMNTNYLA